MSPCLCFYFLEEKIVKNWYNCLLNVWYNLPIKPYEHGPSEVVVLITDLNGKDRAIQDTFHSVSFGSFYLSRISVFLLSYHI